MNQWVSFDELKARVSIEDVLDHYRVADLRRRRDELIRICPFHDETKGSFSANVVKNIWQCFGCKRSGNIFDFVIEKGDAENVRAATLLLADWFDVRTVKPSAGEQLDVFTPLSDGPKATDELAVVLSVGSFRLTPLLYALVAAGLLIVERDRFSNTAETNKFLVNGLPDYRGHTQTASEESTVGRRWTSIQCRGRPPR